MMNSLRKSRFKSVFKYTWPFYLLSVIVIIPSMIFVFGLTHRTPAYKTITLFVSGEMKDNNKLRDDLIETYKENQLKSVTVISSAPTDPLYESKLTVPGYNTADILVITKSKLDDVVVSAFALELNDELINEYYSGYSLYSQEDVNYGIKINKEKIGDYFLLPEEDCYLILSGKSVNTGKYSPKGIGEYNNALRIVKDWGM